MIAMRCITLIVVAAVGGLCAVAVDHGCFHPPPPVTVLGPGTARHNYCSAVHAAKPWIAMALIPVIVIALAGFVAKTPRALVICTLVVCAVLLANAIAANSLNAALTI
jgi:hypothetical protein